MVLGPSMTYTCACYPTDGATLEEAQAHKYDLVARKLGLKPGMRLLDVGCGWGGMVRHAAKEYGVSVLGVTLSREQASWAQGRIADALGAYLDQNREVVVQTAGQLVKNRLTEATENIKKYTNDGSLIRFETTLRQKDLYEQGVDQGKVLNAQQIHRPGMPGEDWNYWAFQGEFWIDEIGYYQYTLKRGCPAKPQ